MNILRAILIGLASFIYVIAVSGFVYVLTLDTTIMDRAVVKTWLKDSQIYDGQLISALVQTPSAAGEQPSSQSESGKISASPEAVKAALNAAFTPDFTQTQLEGVVDNAYNWIDGTSPEFKFSIPIDQKRDTLITQLAKAIEPQVATLPVCRSATQSTQQSICRPATISVEQFATEVTTQSIDESGAFSAPLTNASFTKNAQTKAQPSSSSTLANLPVIKKVADTLLIALPIIALACILIIITATKRGQRLAAASRLSRRIFFGMLFLLIPSLIVVWLAKDNDFGLSSILTAQSATLLIPLIKTIAVGILSKLALISGIIGGISLISWIGLSIWRHQKPEAVQPLIQAPPQPVAQTPSPIDSQSPTLASTPVSIYPPAPTPTSTPAPAPRDETTLE